MEPITAVTVRWDEHPGSKVTLVTGATGIAGRHVADAIERKGLRVLRVSRQPDTTGQRVDITDRASIEHLPRYTSVVHCAGLTPRSGASWDEFCEVNVVGTVLLAEDAVRRGADLFVYLSTAGRLGRRNSASKATRLYVLSKYLAERRIRQLFRDRVPVISLRAASLYGEHDRGSMSRLIRGIALGRFALPVVSDVPKCLLYAGSLAGAIATAVASESRVPWTARGIADLRPYTLDEIVSAIEGVVGRRALRLPLSMGMMSLGFVVAESAGRVLSRNSLVELAQAAKTAFAPVRCGGDNLLQDHPGQHVGLLEGVRREVEWMRASGAL